ncbi:MAG: hypothetical protein RLY21_1573 [Planctomycetota bacterium]
MPHLSIAEASESLQRSHEQGRTAVFVFGSGLLKHCRFGPFADWATLMHEIASHLRVDFDSELAACHPTLLFESLLVRAVQRNGDAAHKREEAARQHTAEVVRAAASRIECPALRNLVDSIRCRSIVTLNYTAAPFVRDGEGTLFGEEVPCIETPSGKRVWCPHGNERSPTTIRLGVRGYSRTISQLECLRENYQKARRERTAGDRSFMHDVLESPLVFAGCGLHEAEWTLWWLLASKARNSAKHDAARNIYITARDLNATKSRLLEAMGCDVLRVESHARVWETVAMFSEKH